jgi:methanethiol S-methyltransferase
MPGIGLLYGISASAIAAATALYGIGFMANLVPRSIDAGVAGPWPVALIVDVLLLGQFAVQHSVMARPGFKRRWTRLIANSIERSTYVLVTCLSLALLFWFWRPISHPIWTIEQPVVRLIILLVFWLGWLMVLFAGLRSNYLALIGLRQVLDASGGRPVSAPTLTTSGLYRLVRHPIYVGTLIAFWATPHMTAGHLLFAAVGTAYTVFGTFLEERDLVGTFGDRYRRYQREVRMLLPFPK